MANWIDELKWNDDGLIPTIIQESETGRVLMHAWMNRESLEKTRKEGKAVFWSRSRQKLWTKGESSGHVQHVESISTDCDADTLLLIVKQEGGIACHTGRHSCFHLDLIDEEWQVVEPVVKDPGDIYK